MATVWLYSIISVLLVSLVSLIGAATIALNLERLKKILLFLVSFAAGALLGDAFIHLIPEAFEESKITVVIPFVILFGILLFFILEKILFWRHCHVPTSEDHPHPLATINLIGDGVHNFIDGMIIAGSYLVSVPLGVTTTIAVVLHEIPQEIGDFSILLHAGMSKGRALFYNFLSAIVALAGAVLVLLMADAMTTLREWLIPFTVGGFIYIATADLLPELKKETDLKKSFIQLGALLLGIGIMALFLLWE